MWYVGRIQIFLTYVLAAVALSSCKFPFSKNGDEETPGSSSAVSATPYFTISALDSSVVPNGCHGFRVTLRDTAGNPAGMEERTTVYVSTSTNVQVFRNDSCTQGLNYLTFSPNNSSKIFYTKASSAEDFNLMVDAGASDIAAGSTQITMAAFGPADADNSSISGTDSIVANGSATSSITVTLKDQYGNAVVGETPSISATGSSNTFSACSATNSSGISTCTLKSTKAEIKTLTLDSPVSLPGGTVTFVPGDPAKIRVISEPGAAQAGSPFGNQPAYEILDANDNLASSSSASVTVAIHSGTGSLLGTKSVSAVSGIVTFSDLQINEPDTFVLRATSPGLTSADTISFAVSSGSAAKLGFSVQPSGAVAGSTFETQVQIQDSVGNLVSSNASVTVKIHTGSGTLDGTTTLNATNGVVNFSDLRIDTAATFTLKATSDDLTGASSSAFTVGHAAAKKLAFATAPAGFTAGAAFTTQPVVEVLDQFGNRVSSSSATIAIAKQFGPASGEVQGTASVNASSGLATFSGLHIDVSGSYTIRATSTGLDPVSLPITVFAGDPAKLKFTVQPSGAVAGTAMTSQPKVELWDSYDNLTSSGASVTLSLSSGTGEVVGTTTITATSGVAAFSGLYLKIAQQGAKLTATSGSLTAAVSDAFDVSAGEATKLAFDTQPGDATSGGPFGVQPKVSIRDAENNVVDSSAQVDIVLYSGSGTLIGTASLNASEGYATFSNLQIDTAGSGSP